MSERKNIKLGKATVKTPVKDLRKEETIEHYNAVLLEDIKSKMETVIEGMETTKVELRRDINDFRSETNQRFSMLEMAVGKNSEDINSLKTDVGGLKADVGSLKTDVKGLKTDVEGLKTDVGSLKSDVKDLKADVKDLKADVGGLKAEVRKNSSSIDNLGNAMHEMEYRLSAKIDAVHSRMDEHEEKPANIAHT